jgi:uncharacterized membrane protein YphA (DoxX/SURF4 family)
MPRQTDSLLRTIALARIATSPFFLLFGQYKVFGSGFAHGGFQHYLEGFIRDGAVSTFRPFLASIVLPHAVFFGYMVGVVELFIGISLLLGWQTRIASVIGAVYMLLLTLATWWQPGHGVPLWRYFGAELDHLPLLFLFVIFFVANAGVPWGLDGRTRAPRINRSGTTKS